MRVIQSALHALFEDVVPAEALVSYDMDDARGALSLNAQGGIREHDDHRVFPEMVVRTDEELERGARLLLLRAAQRVRPDDIRLYFDVWDLYPPMHSLSIDEHLVGGGLDIERGDALLFMTDPNLLGLVARQEGRSSVVLHNPRGVVRLDPNAPALGPVNLPRRFLERRETQAVRRKRFSVEQRAKALLFRYLTREQKWELRAHRRITVWGQDGREYRIYAWQGMNVKLVENGEETTSLCVVPKPEVTTLPVLDLILAQKIMLETEVGHFLETAVHRTIRVQVGAAAIV